MPLTDLWNTAPDQLREKQVSQVIEFAGKGKLRDGGDASSEFRDFLSLVPSSFLSRYADECLTTKFEDGGLALQDVVNQIGRRLGFDVVDGSYRGAAGKIGFDGIWKSDDGHAIVIEVKTTDAYRIDLDVVAGYRQALIQDGTIRAKDSSILIVVGREDTGDLEAQIRGSRHAWDTRLISVERLTKLIGLKENLEEPLVVRKIRDILRPQEFTKVDGIIDIVFATAEDVLLAEVATEDEAPEEDVDERRPKFTPSAFHEACIRRIESRVFKSLIRKSRATYASTDGSLAVLCMVSRSHIGTGRTYYWFAFHPHQRDGLMEHPEGYVGLGCGSENALLLIPIGDFATWLEGMNVTQRPDRFYWHVHILHEDDRFLLRRKTGYDRVDLTKYLLPSN